MTFAARTGADPSGGRRRSWLTRSMSLEPRPELTTRLRSVFPSLLVAAVALGYVALDLGGEEIPATVPGDVPPSVHAGLVTVQALALLARPPRPLAVFAVVVATDVVILSTTAGELGIGALGVVIAAYTVARRVDGAARLVALGAAASATALIGSAAMAASPMGSPAGVVLATAAARVVVLYLLPAAAAGNMRGRERLREALDAQERSAERERRDDADRAVWAERAALARELHDVAGHHLSGIIVGAQASAALIASDPDRAREMLGTVQDDARITLGDLRRTVGLLRDDEPEVSGRLLAAPTMAGIDRLAEAARERGQDVTTVVVGETRPLGPLAEATAYRMVQESLANAARHAPRAPCRVTVTWADDHVEVVVRNEAAGSAPVASGPGAGCGTRAIAGYGLAGMAERAELVGARLTTGPDRHDGGWTNRLVLLDDTGRPS